MEGSFGMGGKLGSERLMNKAGSFHTVDKPHSQAGLEHWLLTSFEMHSPIGPASQHRDMEEIRTEHGSPC